MVGKLSEQGSDESEVLRGPEVCRILGIHRNTLYKLIRAGEVPAFKLASGGKWCFHREHIEDWFEVRQARARS